MNPFRYGKIVSGEHYCSRVEDERLSKAIRGGRNVALIGRRRVGKSSSIYHVAGNLLPKHTLVYADFYQVGSVEDIVQRILTGLPRQGLDWLREFAKGLTRLRPKIELDPATGIPSLALGSDAVMDEHSLEQILTELGKLKRTIVAFDEFQDVATLETGPAVLARMRSIIQRQETVYVFSGSIRKSMSVIFEDSREPFFRSAEIMLMGPIDTDRFADWIIQRFGNRRLSKAAAADLIEKFCGIPGEIQKFCAALWDVSQPGQSVSTPEIQAAAYEFLLAGHQYAYENIYFRYTTRQRKILWTLAHQGTEHPFSASLTRESGASTSLMRKTIERLKNDRILFQDDDGLFFDDVFFSAWIRWRFPA